MPCFLACPLHFDLCFFGALFVIDDVWEHLSCGGKAFVPTVVSHRWERQSGSGLDAFSCLELVDHWGGDDSNLCVVDCGAGVFSD